MKKRIFITLLVILTLFSVICLATENTDVMSISEEQADYVIPEEYRRDEIMPISEEMDVQHNEGDTFILEEKSTVISNRNINGNTFILVADDVELENITINGNLFVFSAESIKLTNTHITGSIFSFSKKLITTNINVSDIYALASEEITLEGQISRELKALSDNIELDCKAYGNVLLYAKAVEIKENAVLNKNTKINYERNFEQSNTATVENIEANKIVGNEETTVTREEQIRIEITNWIIEIVKTIIAIGFVILFTDRKFERFSSKLTTKNYIGLTLKGIMWLIIIPVAAIILIIISNAYLFGLPMLAIVIYFIIAYLSLQIVSISIGSNIKNKKIADKGNIEYIGIILLTMTVLWLLAKLPVIGIIVWFIIVSLSFGIMMKYIFNNKEKEAKNKEENIIVELKEEK